MPMSIRRPSFRQAYGGPGIQYVRCCGWYSDSPDAGTDSAHLDGRPGRRWTLGGDRERLLLRVAVEQEKAADHLLGLGERAVDDDALAAPHPHACAVLLGQAQRLARAQHPPLLERGREAHHPFVPVLADRPGLVARAGLFGDQQQKGHACLL